MIAGDAVRRDENPGDPNLFSGRSPRLFLRCRLQRPGCTGSKCRVMNLSRTRRIIFTTAVPADGRITNFLLILWYGWAGRSSCLQCLVGCATLPQPALGTEVPLPAGDLCRVGDGLVYALLAIGGAICADRTLVVAFDLLALSDCQLIDGFA